MNQKRAKFLRKQIKLLAGELYSGDRILVTTKINPKTAKNHPKTLRAIYQQLKETFKGAGE
jgi:hypothetical protein